MSNLLPFYEVHMKTVIVSMRKTMFSAKSISWSFDGSARIPRSHVVNNSPIPLITGCGDSIQQVLSFSNFVHIKENRGESS